ncbi:MAG: hypothetical protein R2910_11990 [Gemmatimonadales bacterium]
MSEPHTGNAPKLSWHFWVVSVGGLLWSAIGAFDYVMSQTRNANYMANFTPTQLEFFYSLPAWVVACWAIGVWGGVVGCLLLLLRKGAAVPVLLASLIGAILTFIHNFLLSEGVEAMGGGASAVIFPIIIVVISLGLWWYARAMKLKGVIA